MTDSLTKLIYDLTLRTRLLANAMNLRSAFKDLNERQLLILELIGDRTQIGLGDITAHFRDKAASTISADVSDLWTSKALVQKNIDPENQCARTVKLTREGEATLASIRRERFKLFSVMIQALKLSVREEKVILSVLKRSLREMDAKVASFVEYSGSSNGFEPGEKK